MALAKRRVVEGTERKKKDVWRAVAVKDRVGSCKGGDEGESCESRHGQQGVRNTGTVRVAIKSKRPGRLLWKTSGLGLMRSAEKPQASLLQLLKEKQRIWAPGRGLSGSCSHNRASEASKEKGGVARTSKV